MCTEAVGDQSRHSAGFLPLCLPCEELVTSGVALLVTGPLQSLLPLHSESIVTFVRVSEPTSHSHSLTYLIFPISLLAEQKRG